MKIHSLAAICAASAVLVAGAVPASADDISNSLEETYDVATGLELMRLSFDGLTGTSRSTVLTVTADPGDEFRAGGANGDGCNFVGSKQLTVTAESDPDVVTVDFAGDNVLEDCGDSITVVVTAVGVGETDIVFDGVFSANENAAMNKFFFEKADFHVIVDASGGAPSGCDVDPAAPAWAAAILQTSGVKPNSGAYKNAISAVAQYMGPGTDFTVDGVTAYKDGQFTDNGEDYDYADAVWAYLAGPLGMTRPNGDALASPEVAKRPGWTCMSI